MMENLNKKNSLEHLLEEIQEHLNKIDHLIKPVNPRLQKGIQLYNQGCVKENKPNTWIVKGQKKESYNVEKIPGLGWSCDCPDHTYRDETCKHIHAAKIQKYDYKVEREGKGNTSPSTSSIGVRIGKNNNKNLYSLDFFSISPISMSNFLSWVLLAFKNRSTASSHAVFIGSLLYLIRATVLKIPSFIVGIVAEVLVLENSIYSHLTFVIFNIFHKKLLLKNTKYLNEEKYSILTQKHKV